MAGCRHRLLHETGRKPHRKTQRQNCALCAVHRLCLRHAEKRPQRCARGIGSGRAVCAGKDGSGWAIRLHGKSETGAWGEAPARDQWQFVQVGTQNWGYTAETGNTAQGVQSSGRFYLFSDDRNRIRSSFIPNGEDTAGYYGNCSNYKGRERRNCEEGQTSLDAKLSFNRKMKPEFGVWAVEARLSGTKGKKRYRNRLYLMPDNGKTHVVPKDYPLYVDVGND